MDARQIELVRLTFARAAKLGPHVAATFYSELFAIEPALRPMFRGDMVVQGEKLMTMLSQIVDGLPSRKPSCRPRANWPSATWLTVSSRIIT